MRSFPTLALSLLVSCTPIPNQGQKSDPPPPKCPSRMEQNVQVRKKIHIDARFASDEVEAIKEAANAWSTASDGIVDFEVAEGFRLDASVPPPIKIVLLRLNSTDQLATALGMEEGVASRVLVAPGSVILAFVMDRMFDKEQFKLHVMRALGADLGLPTIAGKYPAVMNSDVDVRCLTKYDMVLFCAKYVCNWREMNYCEPPSKRRAIRL